LLPFERTLLANLVHAIKKLSPLPGLKLLPEILMKNIEHVDTYQPGQASLEDEGISWGHGVLAGQEIVTSAGLVSGRFV